MLKKHVFVSLNLNNSEIFRLSFEDTYLETLDTYTEKKTTLDSSGGEGAHGKFCWLITYYNCSTKADNTMWYNNSETW